MENILEPELFLNSFGPYITPDPISLDLWTYLKENFVDELCFQIQPMYSVCNWSDTAVQCVYWYDTAVQCVYWSDTAVQCV